MHSASSIKRTIDHITYVARPESVDAFYRRWEPLGFTPFLRLETRRYPASHVALVCGGGLSDPGAAMNGVSFSDDPRSPINESIRRYGEGPQHVAYAIDPSRDFGDAIAAMRSAGTVFMTSILTHRDPASGGVLRQAFVAPARPYGTFIELVQRTPGPDGAPFDVFDVGNIESLYEAYDHYSAWMERRKAVEAPSLAGRS
jgi:hypothetical protein